MTESWDAGTKETVRKIPLLKVQTAELVQLCSQQHMNTLHIAAQTKAGPRDKQTWEARLKEVRYINSDLLTQGLNLKLDPANPHRSSRPSSTTSSSTRLLIPIGSPSYPIRMAHTGPASAGTYTRSKSTNLTLSLIYLPPTPPLRRTSGYQSWMAKPPRCIAEAQYA